MADRTLAEAVADLRITDRRLQSDLTGIRARLLRAVTLLEADASVGIRVHLDEDSLGESFAGLDARVQELSTSVAVKLNTDNALGDLGALQGLADGLTTSAAVKLNTDQALDDLGALQGLADGLSIAIPIHLDTDNALEDMGALESIADGLSVAVPIHLDADRALDDLGAIEKIADGLSVAIPLTLDSDRALDDLGAIEGIADGLSVAIPIHLDVDNALSDLGAIESLAAGLSVPIPVHLDIDKALDDLGAIESLAEGISIPVSHVGLDTSEARRAVDGFGSYANESMGRAGEAGGNNFMARVGGIVKGGMAAVGLAAGGFLTKALIGGFDRLTTIEDATASLTIALGSAVDATVLLAKVQDTVRGTPFSLDLFAEAASKMVAFGIEAQKVPGYMTAIGEAAASKGSRANEFAQRLADTFGQIKSQGKITGEDLMSLSSVGVNALAILGNAFDKTTGDMRDMVSKGAVPADKAMEILSKGILEGSDGIAGTTAAFAGTMVKLRETLSGSISGFSSATRRFGLEAIKPLEPLIISGFIAAAKALDLLAPKVRAAFTAFGKTEAVEKAISFFSRLPSMIDPLLDKLGKLAPLLAPLSAVIAGFGANSLKGLPVIGKALGALGGPLGIATAGFLAFAATQPKVREAFEPLITEVGPKLSALGGTLATTLTKALVDLTPAIVTIVEAFVGLVPVFDSVVEAATPILGIVIKAISGLAAAVEHIPVPVITALLAAFIGFKALSGIGQIISGISTSFQQLTTSLSGKTLGGAVAGKFGLTAWGAEAKTGADQITESVEEAADGVEAGSSRMGRVLGVGAAAVAGAFSGMALASDDSATQITGAIGAISAIGTGFAVGGPWGAAIAAAGVGIGILGDKFFGTDEKAAKLKVQIDSLTRSVNDQVIAFEKDTAAANAFGDVKGPATTGLIYGQTGFAALEKGKGADGKDDGGKADRALLSAFNVPTAGLAGGQAFVELVLQAKGGLAEIPEVWEKAKRSFGKDAPKILDLVETHKDLDKLLGDIKLVQQQRDEGRTAAFTSSATGISPEDVELYRGLNDEKIKDIKLTGELNKLLQDHQEAFEGAPREQLLDRARTDAAFAAAVKLAEKEPQFAEDTLHARKAITLETAKGADAAKLYEAAEQKFLSDNITTRRQIYDLRVKEAVLATTNAATNKKFTEEEYNGLLRYAALTHQTVLDLVNVGAPHSSLVLLEREISAAEDKAAGLKSTLGELEPPIDAATIAANHLAAAVARSESAASAVGDEFQRMAGIINSASRSADIADNVRDTAAALDEVINQTDVAATSAKSNALGNKIEEQAKRVAELRIELEQAIGDAEAHKTALTAQRDELLRLGATRGAGLVQHEIDTVFEDAEKKQRQLDEALEPVSAGGGGGGGTKAHKTGGETLRDHILKGADKAGLSIADFVEFPPDDETAAFLKARILAPITTVQTEVQAKFEKGEALFKAGDFLGSKAAFDEAEKTLATERDEFRIVLTGMFGPDFADEILADLFPIDKLLDKITFARVSASNQILYANEADWAKLSLDDKLAQIERFRGLEIPVPVYFKFSDADNTEITKRALDKAVKEAQDRGDSEEVIVAMVIGDPNHTGFAAELAVLNAQAEVDKFPPIAGQAQIIFADKTPAEVEEINKQIEGLGLKGKFKVISVETKGVPGLDPDVPLSDIPVRAFISGLDPIADDAGVREIPVKYRPFDPITDAAGISPLIVPTVYRAFDPITDGAGLGSVVDIPIQYVPVEEFDVVADAAIERVNPPQAPLELVVDPTKTATDAQTTIDGIPAPLWPDMTATASIDGPGSAAAAQRVLNGLEPLTMKAVVVPDLTKWAQMASAFGVTITPEQQKLIDASKTTTKTTTASGPTTRHEREGGLVWQDSMLLPRDPGRDPAHIAQIVGAGTWRVFAEPETGGEGYIPLSPLKRQRSTQVLESIASLFGLQVLPRDELRESRVDTLRELVGAHANATTVNVTLPAALTAPARIGAREADLIGAAVARHMSTSAARRITDGDRADHAVHVESGAIVIQEVGSPRRTAGELVSKLARLGMP